MTSTSNTRSEQSLISFTHRLFCRIAALAIAVAQGALMPLPAQGRSAEETRTIDAYRLTMPTLVKVLPALYAEGADTCERQKGRDPHTLSIAEMTRSLERCAPVLRALERAEVTSRVLRDNALLLEQNDPEIRRLTKTGAQS